MDILLSFVFTVSAYEKKGEHVLIQTPIFRIITHIPCIYVILAYKAE
ncbi:hypothetical protein GCM10008967_42920 [Bacillus carboniphilus]|uniref:Uncharacterized protein n=1 Tax=Bacillus carboniphilus TaxID=86663 RepID=A0ABP3GKC6_9BACI